MTNVIEFPIERTRPAKNAKAVENFMRLFLADGPQLACLCRVRSMKISPEREYYDAARLALGLWCVGGDGGWWLAFPSDLDRVPPRYRRVWKGNELIREYEPPEKREAWKITAGKPRPPEPRRERGH